jgi:hypothetical protein
MRVFIARGTGKVTNFPEGPQAMWSQIRKRRRWWWPVADLQGVGANDLVQCVDRIRKFFRLERITDQGIYVFFDDLDPWCAKVLVGHRCAVGDFPVG